MKEKIKLAKHEKQIRIDIYCYAWEKYKHKLTLTSLANILKTSVPNLYQIIKRKRGGKNE